MLIALHRDTGYIVRNSEICHAEIWAEILEAQGVDIRWVDLTSHDPFDQVKGCDGVMWNHGSSLTDKLTANRILHSIELCLGIPVHPNHYASWHHDEKIAVYYLLKAAGVPMPPTWIFWNKEEAIQWANQTYYPKVFKLSPGAGGYSVVKVNSAKEACRLIERMFGVGISKGSIYEKQVTGISKIRRLVGRFKEGIRHTITGEPVGLSQSSKVFLEKRYAYFQEFIPHDFETRVNVMGDRIWASRRISQPGDFRVNSSGTYPDLDPTEIALRLDPSQIDLRCVRMAIDVCTRLGFSSMTLDFLVYNEDPVVTDIGYTISPDSPDRPYPGAWNRNLEWTEGVKSRKEAEVKTFLEKVRSGQRPQLQPNLAFLELLP